MICSTDDITLSWTPNAIGEAGEELQLVLIVHLGTDDVVECLEYFR